MLCQHWRQVCLHQFSFWYRGNKKLDPTAQVAGVVEVGVGLGWSLSWGSWNETAEARSDDSKGSKGKWTREITTFIISIQQRGAQSIWQPVRRRPGLQSWCWGVDWLQACVWAAGAPANQGSHAQPLPDNSEKHKTLRKYYKGSIFLTALYLQSTPAESH